MNYFKSFIFSFTLLMTLTACQSTTDLSPFVQDLMQNTIYKEINELRALAEQLPIDYDYYDTQVDVPYYNELTQVLPLKSNPSINEEEQFFTQLGTILEEATNSDFIETKIPTLITYLADKQDQFQTGGEFNQIILQLLNQQYLNHESAVNSNIPTMPEK